MFSSIFLTLLFATSAFSVLLGSCSTSDTECMMKHVNKLFYIVAGGIPALEITSIDPLYAEVISRDFPNLEYKLTNITTKGFRNCIAKKLEFNLDTLKAQFELNCPSFILTGNYEIDGKFGELPVKGEGTYRFVTGRYVLSYNLDLEQGVDNNGKIYLIVKEFKVKPNATEPVKFEFENLFSGRKELSDPVSKYINKNWKVVAPLFDVAIASENSKVLFENLNKILKVTHLENVD